MSVLEGGLRSRVEEQCKAEVKRRSKGGSEAESKILEAAKSEKFDKGSSAQ